MAWSFGAFSVRTRALLATLNVTQWTHTETLNDAGSFSCEIAPPQTADEARVALGALLDGRSTIVAARDGRPLFEGWVRPGQQLPSLAGPGLLGYLDNRVYVPTTTTRTWTATDPFSIVAELVTYSNTNGAGIDTTQIGTSGLSITFAVNGWERDANRVGKLIRQLAELTPNFDFDVRVENDLGRRIRCWYPRRGRPNGTESPVGFAVGGNVLEVPDIPSSENFVTQVHGVGSETNSATQQRRTASRANAVRLGLDWPLIDAVVDEDNITDDTTLQARVDGYLRRFGTLQSDTVTLRVDPFDAMLPAASWEIGDDCTLYIPPGRFPWWPDGYGDARRIVGQTWTFEGGAETLTVDTAPRWTP